jgi:hypothetical protein
LAGIHQWAVRDRSATSTVPGGFALLHLLRNGVGFAHPVAGGAHAMQMPGNDRRFGRDIAALYQELLVPLIFAP